MSIVGVSIADLARTMMILYIMTALTAAAAQLECQDCTTVTNTLKDIVTTKEDIDIQIEVKEKIILIVQGVSEIVHSMSSFF